MKCSSEEEVGKQKAGGEIREGTVFREGDGTSTNKRASKKEQRKRAGHTRGTRFPAGETLLGAGQAASSHPCKKEELTDQEEERKDSVILLTRNKRKGKPKEAVLQIRLDCATKFGKEGGKGRL